MPANLPPLPEAIRALIDDVMPEDYGKVMGQARTALENAICELIAERDALDVERDRLYSRVSMLTSMYDHRHPENAPHRNIPTPAARAATEGETT